MKLNTECRRANFSCVLELSQDFEEMSSQDLADSIQEMHVKKRCVPAPLSPHGNEATDAVLYSIAHSYNEIFFMVDTCQAGSLSNALESPKVVTIGSSQTGENSYAHHSDFEVCSMQLRLSVAVVLTCGISI